MNTTTPRLLQKYRTEVIPALQKKFSYANAMAVPKIEKVVINIGIGRIAKETKIIDKISQDISKITGQKPVVRIAKKSIAGFKVRAGMKNGLVVTLRKKRMYDFIDRLISVALPRSRDFHGISAQSIDQSGNLSIGIKEHTIFPEGSYESLRDIFGFQITVATSASNKIEGQALFAAIGFPIKT